MYLFDLELNPVIKPKSGRYTILEITDIQHHGNHKRPTENQASKLIKAIEKKQPVRTYHEIDEVQKVGDDTLIIKSNILGFLFGNPQFASYVEAEKAKGHMVILGFPEGGIPSALAKDAKEFMIGTKGERKTRRLKKKGGV